MSLPHPRSLRIADYSYDLPPDRIASHPATERDASRLLQYRGGEISDHAFSELPGLLPAGLLLVFNQTRVVQARLLFRKESGSLIEVFCLEPDARYGGIAEGLQQTGEVFWRCMVGGAAKWKAGLVLQLSGPEGLRLSAAVSGRDAGAFLLHFSWNDGTLNFADILEKLGRVPLPPYLNREAEEGDKRRYQTLFARDEGSVAAPTAALHFTPAVMQSLAAKGIGTALLTLHVGAGTFRPVKSETMEGHDMHAEFLEVTATLVQSLLAHLESGIAAVGTTSLRTLESLYWIGCKLAAGLFTDFSGIAIGQWEVYEGSIPEVSARESLEALLHHLRNQPAQKLVTRTQILIAPGYRMRTVRGLVTNFHQPQSTLLLLVAALAGAGWRRVYAHALANGYRFLSYGDSSLLWALPQA